MESSQCLFASQVNLMGMLVCTDVNLLFCFLAFLFFPADLLPPQFVAVTEDHNRMYQVIKTSGLDWVAVFPPHITDAPDSNGDYEVNFKH